MKEEYQQKTKQTKKDTIYDLTEGPILNKLLLVAIPIMGTQFMQMMYNLTDMFWLGKVGREAVAASGTSGMYLWLSMAFVMYGRMGAEIGVSQSLGRKETDLANAYSRTALFISAVLGLSYALVMILFRDPLIGFFNIPDPKVVSDSAAYLAITGIGMPAVFISGAITGTFNGSGNSRTPFYINLVGLFLNMLLDPVFILVLNLGIRGAAIATSAAQITVAVLFLLAVKKAKNRPFQTYRFFSKPEKKLLVKIIKWSTPIALESMLFTFLSMIIARFVAAFGTDAISVQRVATQIESLSWLIGGGFASAVTAFVGQNYGAAKWSRIQKGFRISMISMLIWGIIISAVLALGGSFLFSIFLPEPDLIQMGAVVLMIFAIAQVPNCLEYNSAGALRGIGKTIPPSVSSIIGNTLRVPLVYVLSRTSLGLLGIWWGLALGAILRSLITILWFWLVTRKLPKEDA